MSIRTVTFKGSFVIAVGERTQTDHSVLIDAIQKRICVHLDSFGFELPPGSISTLEASSENFPGFSLEKVEFMTVCANDAQEAGVGFIGHDDILPEFHFDDRQMMKVPLKDIPVESTLEFRTFLFLPINNKYITYVKRGGYLTSRQATKLGRFKIEYLHIHEQDAEFYKSFHARKRIAAVLDRLKEAS